MDCDLERYYRLLDDLTVINKRLDETREQGGEAHEQNKREHRLIVDELDNNPFGNASE